VQKANKKISADEARQKIYRYCAYQERTHQDVKNKLFEMGLRTDDVDSLVTSLITEGYLNEERFAKAFAGGKFRIKSWGRIKIIHELEARGLTKNCIQSGMKEIDDADYLKTLHTVLTKKASLMKGNDLFVKRDKLAAYGIQKGFEPELVWLHVKAIIKG
jgi:regulatory protein